MTKRTEGPWKVSKLDGRTINGKAYRNLEGNLVTPAIASIKERTGETEANAAFIITACNCHDELVETLKWLNVEFECRDDDFGGVLFTRNDFDRVRKAIAKVEKSSPDLTAGEF